MRRQKVDSKRERRILIALIVSKAFLAQARKVLDLEAIEADHFRVIAEWCLNYYKEYRKAPGKHIESIYLKWSEDEEDEDLSSAVKDFLESLGEQYEEEGDLNVPYLLDDLRHFLSKRRIAKLQDSITYAMSRGKVEEAEASLVSYRKIEVGQGTGFDPLQDKASWKEAFAAPAQPIITFEGDAGRFFNQALTRDALVGIQAPEKTGKTFLCLEFVMRALRQRRRVALFEVGDLSKSQILLRMGVRWARRPLWKNQLGRIPVPVEIEFDEAEDIGYKVQTRMERVRKTVNYSSTQRGIRRFRRACGLESPKSYIMSSVHPTGTITVQGIQGILDQWEQEHGFIADVIVIDYADILAPEDPKKQQRDQINDTWKALRRLSQERHACVIVPTQASAATYNQEPEKLQNMKHFSEDKRKYGHVTAMMGLNQTWEEKEIGGMRINWLVLREAPYKSNKPLHIGTCFTLGKAICCASLPE